MTSWFAMDELLRSGNIPKPQHWKSDGSTEVEGTSAEEDQDWNDDSDAYWTIDFEGRTSLSRGSVYALVASEGQASMRRGISEINLLVSEEEVNQRTWLALLACAVRLWTNCFWSMCVTMVGALSGIFPRCWSQVSRSQSGRPAKCTGKFSLGHALHCLALHRVMSETCVLLTVNAFSATMSGRVATVSTVLVSQKGSECRSVVVAPNTIDFAFTAENCFMSQCCVLR